MVHPRAAHLSVNLPNKQVLVIGGTGTAGRQCEVFNENNGQWKSIPNTRFGTTQFTATTLLNGKVLITGGFLSSIGQTDFCEIYTPE
jgi:hypothetical protein